MMKKCKMNMDLRKRVLKKKQIMRCKNPSMNMSTKIRNTKEVAVTIKPRMKTLSKISTLFSFLLEIKKVK